MKPWHVLTLLGALSLAALADTPPPGIVKLKGSDGTTIGNFGDALKVNGSFTPSGTTAVTGTVAVSNFPSPTPTQTVVVAGPSPLPVAGSVSVSNFPAPVATQPISGTVTVNAGTNLNTSALALESGGHLASVDLKMPALGQALSAGSVPVVLTAAQLSTLTPPSSVTANAGTNLNTSALALESGGHLASIDTKLTAPIIVAGQSAVGSPPSNPPLSVSGVDGSGNKRHVLTDTDGTVHVNGSGVTQPISAVSLPLPTGAALQSGVNTNLDHSGSGTIASALDTVAAVTNGASACTFTTSGTFSAVLIFVGVTNGVSSPTASTPFSVSGAALSLFVSANTTVVIPVGGFSQMVAKAFSYTSGTATVNWECSSGVGPAGFVGISTAAQASSTTIGSVSLGNSTGKNRVIQTAPLTTTATTANQAILSYTVTAGKTLYLEEFDCGVILNSTAATQTEFGTCQLALNGTVVWQQFYKGPGSGSFLPTVTYSEPIPVTAGQTVVISATPIAVTSFIWTANFGGYEK